MKNEREARGSGVLSNPLSFILSDDFSWFDAKLVNRGNYVGYWSLRSSTTTSSNILDFNNTSLNPQDGNSHGAGYAVRCVQILHQSH